MASGRLFLAATLSLSAFVTLPPMLRAEDSSSETDAKHVFQGEVNANAVFVRSRNSEDAYPTMKLNKGAVVTVVGIRGQWLKIEPPEGSFAYVAKSFINLRGDGTVGRATRDALAHAGSQLNELAIVTLATVHEGEDVQIIGQYNEYFKIKPPKDSYLWINKQFVDPVKTVAPAPAPEPVAPPSVPVEDHLPKVDQPAPMLDARNVTTQPAETVANAGTTPATTPPAQFDAMAEYQKLEDQFVAMGTKSLVEQPLPELLAGYQKVLAADDLPSSMRSIAEIRVATLKVRNDAREKFLAVQENEKKSVERRQALAAERQEIEERIKKNDMQVYAAVGTLRPSSLQIGQAMLYRITDPASGRTIAYLRTNDSKYGDYLGQFVGVRGTIGADPQLKAVIENPVEIQPVDQSKVNVSIAAQIVPPSMLKFAAPTIAPATQPAMNPGASDQASVNSGEPQ